MLTKQLREMERQSNVVITKKQNMNKELVLQDIKSLENVIESISHTIGSDELQDIQFYLQSIKSEIKK